MKVTTRCVVVPPSPQHTSPNDENDINNFIFDNNSNISPTSNNQDIFNAQLHQQHLSECSSPIADPIPHYYSRNKTTTRSWPVIHRNTTSSSSQQFLEPEPQTKTEQLQKYTEKRHFSTHQYDFDQIFGQNNTNYQNYLAARKASNCGFDKSPSSFDMQQQQLKQQQNQEQTQTSNCCTSPPPIIFLLLTLVFTSSATAMLCAAIMTDHWEEVSWDMGALESLVNKSAPSKITNKLEFLLDGKVAKLPFKGKLLQQITVN